MTIELILLGVIGILSSLIGFIEYQNRKERMKLVNAIIAKNAQELAQLDVTDKVQPNKPTPQENLVGTPEMTDVEFDKYILGLKQNG